MPIFSRTLCVTRHAKIIIIFFYVIFLFLNIYVYSNIVYDIVDALVMYNSIKLAAQ